MILFLERMYKSNFNTPRMTNDFNDVTISKVGSGSLAKLQ